MPDNPSEISKYWGKAEKASLATLVNTGDVDVYNSSLKNIESVRREHFPHRDAKNFRSNFRKFASAWALEAEHAGARRGEETIGNSARFLFLSWHMLIYPLYPPLTKPQEAKRATLLPTTTTTTSSKPPTPTKTPSKTPSK
jgi:hypothetical protein